MYFEEIEVLNWRGISHKQLRLTPGLNILYGPNESGKSSLREAVRAALTQNPGSKSAAALAARPWGSNHQPIVKVGFSLGGDSYIITKQFFSTKGSLLVKNSKIIAKDKDAHEQLERLLEKSVWMGSLWSDQGDIDIVRVPRALRGKLVVEEVVSPGILWLEDQVAQRMAGYWTPQGRPKKPLQAARESSMAAEEQADLAWEELRASDRLSEEVSRLQGLLESAQARESELSEAIKEMSKSVGAWDRYRGALAGWEVQSAAAKAGTDWLRRWDRVAEQLTLKWKEHHGYQERLKAIKAQLGQEPSREAIEIKAAQANYLSRLEQSKLREQYQLLKAPEAKQLLHLRQLESEIDRAEAALGAQAMSLSLTAFTALEPELVLDGQELSTSLRAGRSAQWVANQSATIILPGVAELRIEAGTSEVEAMVARRDSARLASQEMLAQWECSSVEQAQEKSDQARALEAALEPNPVAEAELAKLAAACSEAELFRSWTPLVMKEHVRSLRSDIEELEAQWNRAKAAHKKFRDEYESLLRGNPEGALEQSLEALRGEAQSWPFDTPAPLVPERKKLTDSWVAELAAGEQLAEARAALAARLKTLEKEKAKLKPPQGEEVTAQAIEAKQQEQKQLALLRDQALAKASQDLGRLRERGDGYQTVVRAMEAQAARNQESRQAELEAAALKMLSETLRTAKTRLSNDLVGPLQERVSERLSRITEGRYKVNLGAELTPTTIRPRHVDTAPLEDLSFGTREQLMFVTRLCLAEMLSQNDERQALIFDDNLVHTDGARMVAALRMLSEVAEKCQILLLTCHPERYAKIDGASYLEA